jgi:anti-sigma regulatory factor (Ser/Thr protein kinase)
VDRPIPPPPTHRWRSVADGWPLHSFLELEALPGGVRRARLHARQLLSEWGLTELSENVELLVSEVITNAVNASQSIQRIFPVRLWLLSDKARVLILVWDANPQPPERIAANEEAESGRGLLLVETISELWDWYFPQAAGGKIVWALAEMH